MAYVPESLPEQLVDQHTYVICGPEVNYYPNSNNSATAYFALGLDNSWNLQKFKDNLKIEIKHMDKDNMEFDLIGVDPAIANAFRRLLIAETPTICVEHVFMIQNTTNVVDEVLSHRLGLVPLDIHPDILEWKGKGGDPSNDKNTIVFRLSKRCYRKGGTVHNAVVTSADFVWMPEGSDLPQETNCQFNADQRETIFKDKPVPEPVHKDIVLAKMAPGQSVEMELHCIKGVGKTHAKWSPVCTAWYRLLPDIKLLKEIEGERAEKIMQVTKNTVKSQGDKVPPSLFKLEVKPDGTKVAVLNSELRGPNEIHLEKLRRMLGEEEWEGYYQIRRKKDHFIFTIESSGILRPQELFERAVDLLHQKSENLLKRL